jgi:hypothetical protein
MKFTVKRKLSYTLVQPNQVHDAAGKVVGHWTMVYDEGFEVVADGLTVGLQPAAATATATATAASSEQRAARAQRPAEHFPLPPSTPPPLTDVRLQQIPPEEAHVSDQRRGE